MIHQPSCIVWESEFRVRPVSPKTVRSGLNSWVRNSGAIRAGWTYQLVVSIHSLAALLGDSDVAVVSTCGKYVAMPASQGATLSVDIRRIVKDCDEEYKCAPAWADVIARQTLQDERVS